MAVTSSSFEDTVHGAGVAIRFINHDPTSTERKTINKYIARSHVSKFNRKKQKIPQAADSGSTASKRSPTLLRADLDDGNRPERSERLRTQSSHADATGVREDNAALMDDDIEEVDRVNVGDDWHGLIDMSDSSTSFSSASASPRTVSPIFGAFAVNTFDSLNSVETADVSHFIFNHILPNMLTFRERRDWFLEFCEQPMVHSSVTYLRLVAQEMMQGPLSQREQQMKLVLKTKTFESLREKIANLTDRDVVPAKLAISTMVKDAGDLREEKLLDSPPMLLTAHMPWLESQDIGRAGLVIENHTALQDAIASRVGGIDKLPMPGLIRIIHHTDNVVAAKDFKKPYLSSYWNVETHQLISRNLWQPFPGRESPGAGFERCIPRGLPKGTLRIFKDVAIVDQAMSFQRNRRMIDETDLQTLIGVRSTLLHRLGSLPSWEEMPEDQRGDSYLGLYECCRLTTILYFNVVILPQLAESPGVREVLRQLRTLLQTCNFQGWSEDISDVVLWFVCVGGVMAWWTRHRTFFSSCFKELVSKRPLGSLEQVHGVLEQFMWSRSAGEHGLAILWDTVRPVEVLS